MSLVLPQPTLAECEAVIERGLRSFVEVGQALMTIRDNGLYSRSYRTFEDYCQDRWGFVRTRAYQFIDAAAVSKNLDTHQLPPKVESHAAALVKLHKETPELVGQAWSEVIDISDGKPTAKVVKEVVSKYVAAAKRQKRQATRPTVVPDYAAEVAEADRDARLAGLYLALETLGRMPVSAEEVAADVPPGQAHRIEAYIDAAYTWLNDFSIAWTNQQRPEGGN